MFSRIQALFDGVRLPVVGGAILLLGVVLGGWIFSIDFSPSTPPPIISLPIEVRTQPYIYVVVKATSQGSIIKWKHHEGLQSFPGQLADPSESYFMATQPGRYWVCAWTATTNSWLPWASAIPSDPAGCIVIVGDAPPIPPNPVPIPPVPPVPNDPFLPVLVDAWVGELDINKLQQKDKLSSVYRSMSENQFQTMGDWYKAMGLSIISSGLDSSLPKVQRVIGDEWNKVLPRNPTSVYNKVLVGKQLVRMADLLGELK